MGRGRSKRGQRGQAATEARQSGGEAVEAAADPAVGGALADVLPDVLVEELSAPRRLILRSPGKVDHFTRPGEKVTIPLLRDRLEARLGRPVGDEEFKRALVALDRADHIRLIAAGDRSRFTSPQLRRSVEGERETFTSLEINPSFYQAFPKAGKRR